MIRDSFTEIAYMRPKIQQQNSGLCVPQGNSLQAFSRETNKGQMDGEWKKKSALIFSGDHMINAFLQEVLAFQGYECVVETELDDGCFFERNFSKKQLVFIDETCFVGRHSQRVHAQVELFARQGIRVVLLAEPQGGTDLNSIETIGAWQILWKPLDYRQVGQALAQLG